MFDVDDRDLPVPATSSNRVIKGCMTKWLRFFTFFFENPKKQDFYVFWEVAQCTRFLKACHHHLFAQSVPVTMSSTAKRQQGGTVRQH